MGKSLVTMELSLLVEANNIANIVNKFDGLIVEDGLHIVNVDGDKLVAECMDSKFTEVVAISGDEEVVLLNRKPEVKYHVSANKTARMTDLIRLEGAGDFNIIINSNFAFLFNPETAETIDLGDIGSIADVNMYLATHYPNYVVLRKVE